MAKGVMETLTSKSFQSLAFIAKSPLTRLGRGRSFPFCSTGLSMSLEIWIFPFRANSFIPSQSIIT